MNQRTHNDIAKLLSDNYVAVPPVAQRRLESRLVQHRPWQEQEREFVLFNGHYLAIRDRRRPDLPEHIVNLAYLNAQPSYHGGNLSLRLWGGIGVFLLRSEEHTSELQSRPHLVCRLLLEKKKSITDIIIRSRNT